MDHNVKSANESIALEPDNTTENSTAEPVISSPGIETRVIKQLEYYFSDANLPYDKFLLSLTKVNDGWVKISSLMTFKRLISITTDKAVVMSAVKNASSTILEVDEINEKIRRKPYQVLPVKNKQFLHEMIDRSIYCNGFPNNTTMDELLEFAATFGDKTIVKVIPKKSWLNDFKGSAYFIFNTKDQANIFLKQKSVKYKNIELERSWEKEYLEQKQKKLPITVVNMDHNVKSANESIALEPDNTTENSTAEPVISSPGIETRVIKQLEYYFSDANLPYDKFLLSLTKVNDGWVKISSLMTFKRMISITTDKAVVMSAVKNASSTILEVDEINEKIRRKPYQVLPVKNKQFLHEMIDRSIYCNGFPNNTTMDELLEFAATFGDKTIVKVIPKKSWLNEFNGSAYFIFNTKDQANIFLKQKSVKYKNIELERSWEKDYLEQKQKKLPITVVNMDHNVKSANESIALEPDNTTENSTAEPVISSPGIVTRVIKQLEYYFSDANLPYDKFMLSLITVEDGWVKISSLMTFKRLLSITSDKAVVMTAVKYASSTILEVDETNEKIRRKPNQVLPVMKKQLLSEMIDRSIYCNGFPNNTTMDELLEFAATFGDKTIVKVIPKKSWLNDFKGSAYFIFNTKDQANIFLKQKSVKYKNIELERSWEKDYLEQKQKKLPITVVNMDHNVKSANESIALEPDNTTENSTAEPVISTPGIETRVIKQLEYYFSDANLPYDKFLLSLTKVNDGWVKISSLMTFKRLISITTDKAVVMSAVKNASSTILEVDEINEKIRRKPYQVLPVKNKQFLHEMIDRSIYCNGFPNNTTMDELLEFAATFGDKTIVKVIPKKSWLNEFNGSAYFIFNTKDQANIFLKQKSVKYKNIELERSWEKDYLEQKQKKLPITVVNMDHNVKSANESIALEPDNTTENSTAEPVISSPGIVTRVIKQLEYYFSDANLPYDKFMLSLITVEDGWVKISSLMTFKRLLSITSDKAVVMTAVKYASSTILEVDETNEKIRRKPNQVLPVMKKQLLSEMIDRSIYCKGFPKNTTMDELLEFAATFGDNTIVKVIPQRIWLYDFKSSASFVFNTKDQANIFLKQESVKYKNIELERSWEKDFLEQKQMFYEYNVVNNIVREYKRGFLIKVYSGEEYVTIYNIRQLCLLLGWDVCYVKIVEDEKLVWILLNPVTTAKDLLVKYDNCRNNMNLLFSVPDKEEEEKVLIELNKELKHLYFNNHKWYPRQ